MTTTLVILCSYLVGSIPSAYLVARWTRGIDIRQVGSGNVGGSNLRATVGVWATVAVGVFDIAKGAVSVGLALRVGLGNTVASLAGLAAVVGHNWSPWLGFQGGRGMAATLGVLAVLFPEGVLWVAVCLVLGAAINKVAVMNGLGVVTLPLLSAALGEAPLVTGMNCALIGLMIIKRLEANCGFRAVPSTPRAVLINRLLHDRDQR